MNHYSNWNNALTYVRQAVIAGSITIAQAADCIKQDSPAAVVNALEAIKAQ